MGVPFEKVGRYKYRIPRHGKMRVDAVFYASEAILRQLAEEDYASLRQLINVATLPGIVEPALAMPDIHWGYGFPIGGVAAMDAEEGVVSPGGVGFDINCLPEGTRVMTADGALLPIEALAEWREKEMPLFAWALEEAPVAAHAVALFSREEERLVELETRQGYRLKLSEDHPVYTPQGMRPAGDIQPGDKVAVHPFEGVPFEPPPHEPLVTEEDFIRFAKDFGAGVGVLQELRKRGLLPLWADDPRLPALLRVLGAVWGDGTAYFQQQRGTLAFYASSEDLEDFRQDVLRIGYRPSRIYSRERDHTFRGRSFRYLEHHVRVRANSLVLLLGAMGLPFGPKAKQDFLLPEWLSALPDWLVRNFLAGFFGAEMSSPRAVPGHGYNLQPAVVSLSKREAYRSSGRRFLEQIAELAGRFGARVQDLREELDWKDSYRFKLVFRAEEETFRAIYGRIGFAYHREKTLRSLHALFYLKEKALHLREREKVRAEARRMREAGVPLGEIVARTRMNRRFIERSLYYPASGVRPAEDFPTFPEYLLTAGRMLFDSIVSVRRISYRGRVYDLAVAHRDHNFIAEGLVVSNCGVRLLRSSLTREDLEPVKEKLADYLYARIPAGVGSERRDVRLSRKELKIVLREGAPAVVRMGFGTEADLEYIESGGRLPGADPDRVSPRAFERGAPQLGTLGSGNHFLEVQYVDEIYDPEAAEAFGLFEGQITVLIHTGSRGLGHQVCEDYVERFLKRLSVYKIELPDRQLAAAPIKSPDGDDYLRAMAAAANFAFANRQLITHFTREAFEAAGFAPRDHGLSVVYDLAHNNAKFEEHGGRGVLVHRKGATRAFGPGHPEIPRAYRRVGQPVLVPGDMGRYSYVLAGTKGAMRETFGSSCHGAGRRLSRAKAKKLARTQDVVGALREKGIVVRARTRATVWEEIPEAYKDVAEVVEVVHGAGIGQKVARLRPLVVVKG